MHSSKHVGGKNKKRKLEQTERTSPEPELVSKDKQIKLLRAQLQERDSKIADLKQLDWVMEFAVLREQLTTNEKAIGELQSDISLVNRMLGGMDHGKPESLSGMREQLAEMKTALAGLVVEMKAVEAKEKDNETALRDLTSRQESETASLREEVAKLKQERLDKLLGKTIKEFLE